MKNEILAWLNAGQPYEQGVELYAKYGHNSTVLKNFSRKENASRRAKLAYKLVVRIAHLPEEYINMNPKDLPISHDNKVHKNTNSLPSGSSSSKQDDGHPEPVEGWKGKIPYKELPKGVREWINQRVEIEQKVTELSKERNDITVTNSKKNIEKRQDISEKIEALIGEKNEINVKIKYYEDNLKLPEEERETEQSDAEHILKLTKTFNNLKSQRSKYRNKVYGNKEKNKEPIPEGPKKEAARVKLAEIESKIKDVESQLPK